MAEKVEQSSAAGRFFIATKAVEYFKGIKKPEVDAFTTNWDCYYFCLIAGLVVNRNETLSSDIEQSEMATTFIGSYEENKEFILSLFLVRELERNGIDMKDKDKTETEISSLINTKNANKLNIDSLKKMNEYSYGGYQFLAKEIPEPPVDLEVFLEQYHQLLIENFEE